MFKHGRKIKTLIFFKQYLEHLIQKHRVTCGPKGIEIVLIVACSTMCRQDVLAIKVTGLRKVKEQ